MRIHSDVLTPADFYAAARHATNVDGSGTVWVEDLSTHGSRKRKRAFEVRLTGDGSVSRRRPNSGVSGADTYDYAATWSAWGHFLAWLFEVDPNANATYYESRADFTRQTEHAKSHRGLAGTPTFEGVALDARWAEVTSTV